MFRVIAFMFLSSVITVGNVSAQDDGWNEADDVARFETCYSETDPAALLETCNYIKTCIDGHRDNSTSRGMLNCAVKGYELWDAKLNSEYNTLVKGISNERGEEVVSAFREAQRAWLTFRDRECHAVQERGNFVGFVGGAIHKSCLARITAERTLKLRQEIPRWQN